MMQTDREYAEALFMLAAEEGKTEEYLSSLLTVRKLVEENPEYLEFLSSPAISLQERLSAIDEAYENIFPEYVVSFLKLLCENGRIRTINTAIDEYEKLMMAFSNRAIAVITSATPLDEEQKQKVCDKFEKLTGKSIQAVYAVDESLIGGLKVEVEGKTYDGSIKHRLSDVKDVIIR